MSEAPQLLYQDDALVAVHKPAGWLVHRSAIDRHETRITLQYTRDLIGRAVFPVHRLDKPTAGVLLFALTPDSARRLTAAFTGGLVRKTYLCVVRGFTEAEATIDHPLREEPDRITDRDADPDKAPQSAITRYRRLATAELPIATGRYASSRYSLLEVQPQTGRRHQIRRHLKHIFHPVIGDTTHGDGRHNATFREHLACHRLLLTATAVALAHPVTGGELTVAAPLDAEFRYVLQRLGWSAP